jgi:hypothetical protein
LIHALILAFTILNKNIIAILAMMRYITNRAKENRAIERVSSISKKKIVDIIAKIAYDCHQANENRVRIGFQAFLKFITPQAFPGLNLEN